MNFKGKSILSIDDLSTKEIIHVLETAKKLEKKPRPELLKGKILATMFYEPSTRTRLSFTSSMMRLGGKVLGFDSAASTSVKKGEIIHDTMKMIEHYADVVAMRHPIEGSVRLASESCDIPVINAGDGANQHPTQTLLDLYTLKKTQGKLMNLKVAMLGDLKYGRTVHSLATALSRFKCRLYFISPEELKMPNGIKEMLTEKGIKFSEHATIEEVLSEVDILYDTRIQQERFPDQAEYEKVKNLYILKKDMFQNVKKNLRILHPLPRVNEIEYDVDDLPYAHYFEQAGNGIPVRQALLGLVLGKLR